MTLQERKEKRLLLGQKVLKQLDLTPNATIGQLVKNISIVEDVVVSKDLRLVLQDLRKSAKIVSNGERRSTRYSLLNRQ